ncbi:MAG: DUF268 domain-containing protein [Betaproteobacteria bacterium]|nr:DUF268 domain-containing protein [Betaproteobacteria bacterium]
MALFAFRFFSPLGGVLALFAIPRYLGFLADWRRFRRAGGQAELLEFYPCLFDKTAATGIDSHYFYQAIWAFKRILASGASSHVDVGSDVRFVGMLTCITEVTFIDIRPLRLNLERYQGRAGSILALPYPDRSLASLSSLHVVEHVGLGRYGDPIDPDGTRKACAELARVLAPAGRLYLSLPVGRRTRVQFNSQRVFSVSDALALFDGLRLVELSFVDPGGMLVENVPANEVTLQEGHGLDYGLGMFVFAAPGK